jgi:hypothetical protein
MMPFQKFQNLPNLWFLVCKIYCIWQPWRFRLQRFAFGTRFARWFVFRPDDVGIFYGHLVYFTAIWYILQSFGIFSGNLVYFSPFCNIASGRIWQTCSEHMCSTEEQLKKTLITSRRVAAEGFIKIYWWSSDLLEFLCQSTKAGIECF